MNYNSLINLSIYSNQERNKLVSSLSIRPNGNINNSILEILNKKSRGWNNVLRYGQSKIHQHAAPIKIAIEYINKGLRSVATRVNNHNFQLNKNLIYKRIEKGMRVNIRSERELAYKALSMLLIKYLDVDLFGVGLFEIKAPIELLAKDMGVFYKTDNNKFHYDILLKALKDFEEVNYVIVHRSKDELTKSYKASRIWLTPQFFYSMNFSGDDLRKLILDRNNYLAKKNKREHQKSVYNAFLLRLNRHGILDLPNSLNNLLIKIKRKLLGQYADETMISEKRHIEKHEEEKKQARQQIRQRKKEQISLEITFFTKAESLHITPVACLMIQASIKKLHPDKRGDDYWLLCLAELDVVSKK